MQCVEWLTARGGTARGRCAACLCSLSLGMQEAVSRCGPSRRKLQLLGCRLTSGAWTSRRSSPECPAQRSSPRRGPEPRTPESHTGPARGMCALGPSELPALLLARSPALHAAAALPPDSCAEPLLPAAGRLRVPCHPARACQPAPSAPQRPRPPATPDGARCAACVCAERAGL